MTQQIEQTQPPLADPSSSPRRAVNWRSLLLGLIGIAFICSLTAYNDYVMRNTFLVGNFLPIGLLLFFMVVIMLINAPLHLWAPRHAFSGAELAVVLGMTLVSCTLPSSGLMRYLPAMLVGLHHQAISNGEYAAVMEELDLPQWLFPAATGSTVQERANHPVFRYFYERNPYVGGDPGWGDRLAAVPWEAWVTPMITWGLFLVAMYGALLCLMVIVRRQWAENERLAFPLATVYASLIETPEPGRALSSLFRSFGFWIAFAAVFVLHSFNALNKYDPQLWPAIPIQYDLHGVLHEEPWRYMHWAVKTSTLYFSIIGFTYFLQTSVAFSLWFFIIAVQLVRMQMGAVGSDLTGPMQADQTFGATLVFAATILWIGRHHWWMVMQQMVRPPRQHEPQGRYLPYFVAGWGFVLCMLGMVVWLWMAGSALIPSIITVLLLVTFLTVIARVVAETGLIFAQINTPLIRPFVYALNDLPDALSVRTSLRSYFWNTVMHRMFTMDMRESMPAYTINALRVADLQVYGRTRRWTQAIPFTFALLLALAFGYVVSGASMLYTEYNFAATLDAESEAPINRYAIDDTPQYVLNTTRDFAGTNTGPKENHSRPLHFGIGAVLTAGLGALRLRFVNWPLHPVGFLLVYTYPMQKIWFSIMLGWLAKLLLVKYGGAALYRAARPYFIGMIIGEAAVAATWLVVAIVRNAMGLDFQLIRLLPT